MDLQILMIFSLLTLLLLCVVMLLLMRDPGRRAAPVLTVSLWCPIRRERARVTLAAQRFAGTTLLAVQHCSLLGASANCDEACLAEPPPR